jgi:hypothetical protein
MPLQSFTQQTVWPLPLRGGRPLEVCYSNSEGNSQPRPKLGRVFPYAVDVVALWPLLRHRLRSFKGPRSGLHLVERHIPVRAVIPLSLSEDAELWSDSSHGVHRVPLHRHQYYASTLVDRNRPGGELPNSPRVPSMSFLSTSTVCSA